MFTKSLEKKKSGFSLVEILISLITISLIMAAFAPVFTKKANIAIGMGSSKTSKEFPYNPMDPNCVQVENSLDCKFKMPDNVSRLSAVLVSGGGGGAGGVNGEIIPNQIKEVSNGRTEISITKEMKNVTINNLIGGGGGGGGGAFYVATTPPSSSFCNSLGAMYIPAAYNGSGGKDLCVMKDNANCHGVLNCKQKSSWFFSNNGTEYKSKYIVQYSFTPGTCSNYAAGAAKKGQWRLPTMSELAGWRLIINAETAAQPKISRWLWGAGLNLCYRCFSTYTNSTCRNRFIPDKIGANPCSSDATGGGAPNCIAAEGGNAYCMDSNANLYALSLPTNKREREEVFYSVRCVYDGAASVEGSGAGYSSAGGGAGSSGAVVRDVSIPQDIVSSAIGGKIVLIAGSGGTAGAKGASSGASALAGGNGAVSSVEIYKNGASSPIYKISASGGYGGKGATKTSAGAGGAASNICTGNVSSCSQTNSAGNTGLANLNKTTSITSSGGAAVGNGYGAGGAGGFATGTSANSGSVGAAGYAKITYDLRYQGAAGGGGGGSSLIHVDNIPVTAGKEYTIRIGAGGKGGVYSNDGKDGGESAVWFDDISINISGGKGGKKGTGATKTTLSTEGVGGEKGEIAKIGSVGAIFIQKEGTNGANGTNEGDITRGGLGGISGGQVERACGGLFLTSDICTNPSINGESLPYVGYGNIYKDGNYGMTGSGGGGGAWSSDISLYPYPGSGGRGQNGYVYLYW